VQPTTPRDQATAQLGEDVGAWIARQRSGPANLSWQQVALVLAAETGVEVSREAIRLWYGRTVTNATAA
jgi:hypothetical protein